MSDEGRCYSVVQVDNETKSLRAGPFNIVHGCHKANGRMHSTGPDHGEIMIVTSGWTRSIVRDTEQLCTPWSVTYRPAWDHKTDTIGEAGADILRIEVAPDFADQVASSFFDGNRGPIHYSSGQLGDLPRLILREVASGDIAAPLMLDGLLRQLIANASKLSRGQPGNTPPEWLVRAVTLIESQYTADLSISRVAAAVGVHPSYLSRVFHRFRGCAPHEYLSILRIRAAVRALRETSDTLSDIALGLGYCDQAHFSREFKKWIGHPPGLFRDRHSCARRKAIETVSMSSSGRQRIE